MPSFEGSNVAMFGWLLHPVQKVRRKAGLKPPLGNKGKLHQIGVGCPYAGWRVILSSSDSTFGSSASTARRCAT
jgi:hypothetical protein